MDWCVSIWQNGFDLLGKLSCLDKAAYFERRKCGEQGHSSSWKMLDSP